MAFRYSLTNCAPFALAVALTSVTGARAQTGATLRPIPAAECQQLAAKAQAAIGIPTKAGEDDFSDVVARAEGRSCHITGSASNLSMGSAAELMTKLGGVFSDWREDSSYAADGPDGSEKGYTNGTRIATVQVSWEPGPGVACSETQPLSACKITPQQKLWNVVIDVATR
jgi:hypothetical protein